MMNMISITLQTTIAELGFLPDETGDKVKRIIAKEDAILIMVLGCALDACRKEKSYQPLLKNLANITEERLNEKG